MIGTGPPLTRKRTYDWIENYFSVDEDSKLTENSVDSDLEILSISHPGRGQEGKGEVRNWCEEFAPTSSAQLAGNKNKIVELSRFLRESSAVKGPSILRLGGPPGSGKSTALRVLGREAGMEVVEWLSDTSVQAQVNELTDDGVPRYQDGQLRKFKRYLIQSNYSQVYKNSSSVSSTPNDSELDPGVGSSQILSHSSPFAKKLLIVNDIPNTFLVTPSLLHEVLKQYMSRGRQVLAFVTSSSQDSSGPCFRLFPQDLLRQLGVVAINFNSISHVGLKKVLSSVLIQKTARVDTELLEQVLQDSDGDVRFALNTLHFKLYSSAPSHSYSSSALKAALKSSQRGKRKPVRRIHHDNDQEAISSRNHALSSFHAIGKVLHAKRQPWTSELSPPPLPLHLAIHARDELLYQPEHVFESSGLSADMFLGYLHKNAPYFFKDMSELTTAYSYLSTADLLSPLSTPLFRAPSHYAPLVASTGTSHSLTQGVSKFQIQGPLHTHLRATIDNRKSTLKEIAREISHIETDPFTLATGLVSYHRIVSYHYNSPYINSLLSSYRFENTPHFSRPEQPSSFPLSPSIFQSTKFSQIAAESTEICPKSYQPMHIDSFEDDDSW